MRVRAVAILIADRAIRPVDHQLRTLVPRNLAGDLDSLLLGAGLAGNLLAPLLAHRPPALAGHHVLVLLGHYVPPLTIRQTHRGGPRSPAAARPAVYPVSWETGVCWYEKGVSY